MFSAEEKIATHMYDSITGNTLVLQQSGFRENLFLIFDVRPL